MSVGPTATVTKSVGQLAQSGGVIEGSALAEMLSALRAFDEYAMRSFPFGPDANYGSLVLHDEYRALWRQVRAAIARATGAGERATDEQGPDTTTIVAGDQDLNITSGPKPTPQLRWVPRSMMQAHDLKLQQAWETVTYDVHLGIGRR